MQQTWHRRQIFGGGTSITKSRRWRPQINGGGSAGARLYLKCCYHRRRLWGQPGHAPPIIRMGGQNPFFAPPIIRREFCNFVYLKKINMKESRNRDNNTKRTEYILNERCQFCKKSCRKKRSSEILERIEGNFFKIFCLKVNLPKIFAPQYL